ncbi:cell division ATP-binding protein FtsE [Microbacterium allomyrinae]|jgi:cell division transport system ATP-binding protein|uniref:Cell division ATP-binding protein FtsE n=1 Tax=Microbacterium allomyrinae TaxID=2830666 RepID=A0A9X1S4D3_9MICO|nr:cell division ATP-binding protein FtsE [Microbacterium allomyrinae]MCC2034139.1 cell division ATP-binding protein FtsE [Microbacterium allomyrinae]
MIRFENVTKRFRGTSKPALNNVDFEVPRGEFVFLVGASGSGKSSCLRLILREETPSEGRVVVLGRDLRTLSNRKVPYFRRHVGAVFQDFRLLPTKTVFQNVAFTLQVIGSSRGFIQQAVPEVLALVGLAGKEKRFPHELSGGEQQRVAIARALANRPQVLLADEPTGNLDPATSVDIMQLLARINAGGTTVVMATHEAGFVDQMQRRVIELAHGEMVRDERHGGYGDTSGIPSLRPEPERGAAAVAALTAVLEVQREATIAAAAGLDPTIVGPDDDVADAASAPIPSDPAASALAASAPAAPVLAPQPVTVVEPDAADVPPPARPAAVPDRVEEPETASDLPPHTQPIPVADLDEMDVAELGLADRLGLGETEPDDEVGPTS